MLKLKNLLSIVLFSLSLPILAFADPSYQVCFTPGQNCTQLIVQQIDAAQKNIWVQAYAFSSYAIGDALVRAEKRGVDVEVILDKSNFEPGTHTSAYYFIRHGIKVWDDNTLNIAHNKVMIFDGNTVETGSFNYTQSAQYDNAENVLIIHDAQLAQAYLANWHSRQEKSTAVPH